MIHSRHSDLDDAREAALKASVENRGKYVTLFSLFGLEVEVNDRLDPQAPSSSYGGTYWLNGRENKFTAAQRAVDDKKGHLH